jgi:phytoene dehydrogenase-like protein
MKQPPVIVIGGGLSGLIAATLIARANLPTLLV